MKEVILSNNKFYHIYNCGINGMNLFRENENYDHFLTLIDKYILPVAEIFAWVLMPNHFHFLLKIKENISYKYSLADRNEADDTWFDEHKWETINLLSSDLLSSEANESVATTSDLLSSEANESVATPINDESVATIPINAKPPNPNLHLSHLFNAYSKYFNKRYTRHGGLFERRFERKHVDNSEYLKTMVLYIHNNPVHHQFCQHPIDYPWSSYRTCLSEKPTRLKRETVISWFENKTNFKKLHNEKVEHDKQELFERQI